MRLPCLLSKVPRATSSMSAPLIFARPPASSSTARLMSMQPPAAPAVRLFGSFTLRNGYSCAKKYTKAGTITRSHRVSARSRAICETRALSSDSALRTRSRSACGAQLMSASVKSTYPGRAVVLVLCAPAAAKPWVIAQTLPAQPSGRGWPLTTVSGAPPSRAAFSPSSAAITPVPSSLLSSTRKTRKSPG